MTHPRHRRVALVDLRRAEVAQQLDHAADLDALTEGDASRHRPQARLGVVEGEVHEAHRHGLLVVHAHVLQEPDVDGVGVAAGAGVADHPADHPGQERGGHDEDGDVERVLPPGQHDRVVGTAVGTVAVVVEIVVETAVDVEAAAAHPVSLPARPGVPHGEPPQQCRQRQPVADVAGPDLVEHVGPREPLDAFCLVAFGRFPDVHGGRGGEQVERHIRDAVVRVVRGHQRQRTRTPARFLDGLARRRLGGCLAVVDAAARDLPPPRVGGEPVPPQQQHTAFGIVDDGSGRHVRHPYDVVLEALAARQLDVDQRQTDPLAVVDHPLAVHRPPHRCRQRATDPGFGVRIPLFVSPQLANLADVGDTNGWVGRRCSGLDGRPAKLSGWS